MREQIWLICIVRAILQKMRQIIGNCEQDYQELLMNEQKNVAVIGVLLI